MTDKPRHPKGLYVLFFTEMWERFGFYTMLFIFTLYLDEYFHFRHPGTIYGAYLALVYFTPIGGGWVADRLLGFRKTIMLGAILLAAGYGLMSVKVPEPQAKEQQVVASEKVLAENFARWQKLGEAAEKAGQKFAEPQPRYEGPERTAGQALLFAALLVLVIGNGLFKPNISVMVGNLYEEGNPLKDSAFNIFYMGINIGAFFAPLAAAALRNTLGWSWAFGAAALGMLIGLAIFAGFKRFVAHAEIGRGAGSVVKGAELSKKQELSRVLALVAIYAIVALFWMAFHQNGFTLTFWARDCTKPAFGHQIPPEVFGSANSIFVVLLTPVVVWFWSRLRRRGTEPSTPAKMGIGMLFTASALRGHGPRGAHGRRCRARVPPVVGGELLSRDARRAERLAHGPGLLFQSCPAAIQGPHDGLMVRCDRLRQLPRGRSGAPVGPMAPQPVLLLPGGHEPPRGPSAGAGPQEGERGGGFIARESRQLSAIGYQLKDS